MVDINFKAKNDDFTSIVPFILKLNGAFVGLPPNHFTLQKSHSISLNQQAGCVYRLSVRYVPSVYVTPYWLNFQVVPPSKD